MRPSPTADLSAFLITLRHLIREPSVVGAEDSFFRLLRRELEELDISVERHSGVLVARGSDPESVILSAHIDRHGLVCTGTNEFQYAAFVAANRGELTDNHISAQLDNVVSVALIIYLYHIGFKGTALFTAQEEAGRSWRYAQAWFQREAISTNRLLVLDTSPYPTREAAAAQDLVLRRKDASAVFDPRFTSEIENRCDALGISHTFKDEWIERQNLLKEKPSSLGRTELGRLVAASGGQINGTTLQIPTTGYHTAEETASLTSIQAAIGLLCTFIR